ncbi:single-stranded DNA-binding protein [Psychrobacillus glaciei]|uniref:Single-stranded DNA-binding protein n=1 Tax=Psychrobacillus glaciei TaxID=2283160 RepID=A0A5J6SSJ9_9BACI|nr:single-stranded DNA-binding protein [Psychrobacillus glaciei]QFG01022.1 single-stranded DNA-binding protein [Psychrobacillus glaciei]
MINRVVLVGRLTKDPELRYTPSGVAMARFTLAVNRTFSNQQGEREADFINCVVWRKQAENTANFLKKGSLAGVEGRIQTGSYEGQDGKRVYTTDVVADSVQFLEPRSSSGERSQGGQPFGSGQQQQQQNSFPTYQQNQPMNQQNYTRVDEDPFANSSGPIEVSDDDLPF